VRGRSANEAAYAIAEKQLYSSHYFETEIRRCVTIANGLKADLVALIGDYVASDPQAQSEVVQALAGLRAPYGVFGCLGNHEIYTETEDSITRLFAAEGIRILRQERVPIQSRGEVLNLIGIDYQSGRFSNDHPGHLVDREPKNW